MVDALPPSSIGKRRVMCELLLLENEGPEGSGRKTFKIETQCNQKSGPRGLHIDIGY
jgi:hypothetical protein